MSGLLFLIVMDWIMRSKVRQCENAIRWKFTAKLNHLDFVDDIALSSPTNQKIQDKTMWLDKVAK